MSERQPNFEVSKNHELDQKDVEKLSDKNYERLKEAAKNAEADKNSLEAIKERVEKEARSKNEIQKDTVEVSKNETHTRANHQLKDSAFRQKMKEVRRKETPAQRTFSKFIHNPAVEAVSNVTEGTVARPSGLLFGGLFSVIAGLGVLYICNHYGYEYNFTIGLACFVGGFFFGLIAEGVWRVFKK